ncbi:MAG: DUF4365 domain-containing protein [Coleofasciculus sp. E1-EBD-02]
MERRSIEDIDKELESLISFTENGGGFGDPDAEKAHDRKIQYLLSLREQEISRNKSAGSDIDSPDLSSIPHLISLTEGKHLDPELWERGKISSIIMTNLPKRTKSQKIGVSAADLLNFVFDKFCNVIPVPQERDLGIDFICEIMQGEHPTGKLFNIQCKGKEEAKVKGNSITVPIKVTTLNYWSLQSNPTFLIVVDCQNHLFYWSFPQNFLRSFKKNWQRQKTVSIPVPIENCFDQDINTLPSQLASIVSSQASAIPKNGDYLGTLTLGDAVNRAITYGLHVLRAPFHRPFQYIGMPIADAARSVGGKPNEVGNIIVDSEQAHMLLEAEGNFINYVDVELKKTAPWSQKRPFDSEAILGVFSINPSELEPARKQTNFHTYYDHNKKLKISVSCQYEGAPLSVGFSSKYYKA